MLASVSYLLGYRSRRGQDDSVLHDANANDPRRSLLFRRRAESIAGQFEVAFSSDAMSLFGKLESPVPSQDRSLLCGGRARFGGPYPTGLPYSIRRASLRSSPARFPSSRLSRLSASSFAAISVLLVRDSVLSIT